MVLLNKKGSGCFRFAIFMLLLHHQNFREAMNKHGTDRTYSSYFFNSQFYSCLDSSYKTTPRLRTPPETLTSEIPAFFKQAHGQNHVLCTCTNMGTYDAFADSCLSFDLLAYLY